MLAAWGPEEKWPKAFLIMAFNWGFRVNELLKRPVKNVDLKARTVWLPKFSTKSKHPRMVPIGDRELPLLRELIAGKSPEQLVFTRGNGKPIKDFRHRWDKLVAAFGAGHFETRKGEEVWVKAIPPRPPEVGDHEHADSRRLGRARPQDLRAPVGRGDGEVQPADPGNAPDARGAPPGGVPGAREWGKFGEKHGVRRRGGKLSCLFSSPARVAEWQTLRT
jgi:hypothetical protein